MMKYLNENVEIIVHNDPWIHVTIKNILLPEVADYLLYNTSIEKYYEDVGTDWIIKNSNWKSGRKDISRRSSVFRDIKFKDDELLKTISGIEDEINNSTITDIVRSINISRDVRTQVSMAVYLPVSEKSRYNQQPHWDFTEKCASGMIYLRHPDDSPAGTDLFYKPGRFEDYCKTIDNEHNTGFFWPNIEDDTWHCPSEREPTTYHRKTLNFRIM